VQDVAEKHSDALAEQPDAEARLRLLCELNVREQVWNVCRTTVVQGAWERGQELSVHGWVYALEDGLLRDLGLCVTGPEDMAGEKVETVS
jgi:carbonic anhydrase